MPKEIERKFLVNQDLFNPDTNSGIKIAQAYLSIRPESTVRVRILGNSAFLTIKSKNFGAERYEWEYQIPVSDAEDMMRKCDCLSIIEKIRYKVGAWEVDVFQGKHRGLILAEIELTAADETFEKPDFIGREVTDDNRYYNSVIGSSDELPPIV